MFFLFIVIFYFYFCHRLTHSTTIAHFCMLKWSVSWIISVFWFCNGLKLRVCALGFWDIISKPSFQNCYFQLFVCFTRIENLFHLKILNFYTNTNLFQNQYFKKYHIIIFKIVISSQNGNPNPKLIRTENKFIKHAEIITT